MSELCANSAGALGVGRVASEGMNQEAIEERVYKLHHNASQNRVDVFSGVGCLHPPLHSVLAQQPMR